MPGDVVVRCSCGAVEGRARDVGPDRVNRVRCYCDDCQAFAHHLRRADLLDPQGGTDIVQMPPAALTFTRGTERIAGVRLGPKGLYRWYASCCRTPLGNTVGTAVPFVGIVAQAIAGGADVAVGPPIGAILGRFAIGTPPPGSTSWNRRLYARAGWMVFGWWLRGHGRPHPFFDDGGVPRYPLSTLSTAERDALRPFCGPHPTAAPGR